MKPQTEILPIDQAPWLPDDMKKPFLKWAYRVMSDKPENAVIGVSGGMKADVIETVKTIRKQMEDGYKRIPFSRSIKSKSKGGQNAAKVNKEII